VQLIYFIFYKRSIISYNNDAQNRIQKKTDIFLYIDKSGDPSLKRNHGFFESQAFFSGNHGSFSIKRYRKSKGIRAFKKDFYSKSVYEKIDRFLGIILGFWGYGWGVPDTVSHKTYWIRRTGNPEGNFLKSTLLRKPFRIRLEVFGKTLFFEYSRGF
jgi:hypothetical protein